MSETSCTTNKIQFKSVLAISLLTSFGCASHSAKPVEAKAEIPLEVSVSQRRPADADPDVAPMPPTGHTLGSWVYTWTNRPQALSDAPGEVAAELSYTQSCLQKFTTSADEVKVCEGDNMASGPGIYTCDNPFTSRDYGATLVAIRIIGAKESVALATGTFAAKPSSGGLDRSIYANPAFSAIMYDFRQNAFNGRAMVVRNADIVDVAKSYSLSALAPTPKAFKDHGDFRCDSSTPIHEVVSHYSDQLNFLAITYDFHRDSSTKNYLNGEVLNQYGIAAAIASDAAALSPAALDGRIAMLSKKTKEIADTLTAEACLDTGTITPNVCLAEILYNSIVGAQGTPNFPTGAWTVPTTVKALIAIGALPLAGSSRIKTNKGLLQALELTYPAKSAQMQRAVDAYHCMTSVRAQIEPTDFGKWGDDPQ